MPCNFEYVDDTTISNEETLWRRIPLTKGKNGMYKYDASRETWRPTSAAFRLSGVDSAMSVFIESIVRSSNRGPEDIILDNQVLSSLTVKQIRSQELGIFQDENVDSAHANVFDTKTNRSGKEQKRLRKTLALLAQWVIPPPEMKSES